MVILRCLKTASIAENLEKRGFRKGSVFWISLGTIFGANLPQNYEILGMRRYRESSSPCSGSLILCFEVFFVEARSGTAQGPILDQFWLPFWLQKSIKISQKAAKRDSGASQEGKEALGKGVQKWAPKKIDEKSVGNRKRDR